MKGDTCKAGVTRRKRGNALMHRHIRMLGLDGVPSGFRFRFVKTLLFAHTEIDYLKLCHELHS